ncbi:MAG: hypothetical protein PHD00_10650 [Bacteroidales bacterium]|nr:hypothetical protein [Bacteroidales bacterium]MDD4672484.1 hypothetical protein [Bacteroidales bacterium]MDY0347241.1 hypothetical protein [Tenuifilaceae bacterium]
MKKVKVILTSVVISFMFTGCYLDDYRNIEEVQIDSMNPVYGFPLISSSVAINDLLSALDSSVFVEVRNDSVFLVFKEEVNIDLDLDDFNVPDNSFSGTLDLAPTGVAFERYFKNYTIIENDSEIRLVKIKAGTLTVEFVRDVLDDGMEMETIIHSLTIPDPQFSDSVFFISNWAPDSFEDIVTLDLAGATLLLEAEDEESGLPLYNIFSWATTVRSDGTTTGTVINNIHISDVEFEEIIGLINYEVPLPADTLDLSAFTSMVDGEIYFSDPSIALSLGTSFGVPASAELSHFTFRNSSNETRELINEGVLSDNTLLLGEGNKNYFSYATSSDPYVQQLFILNSDNSNLEDVLSFVPVEVILEGHFLLGDYQDFIEDPHSFFVKDTSFFDIAFDIEVPLAGSIKNLKFEKDISDFSWPVIDTIPGFSDFDYDIEVKLKTINQIPLTFGLQVLFVDDGGTAIDSLFNDVMVENIIQSPNIDSEGLPLNPIEKATSIKMNREKYDKVSKASQMRLKLLLDTGTDDMPEVLFKASHRLDVQIALKFNLLIES